MPRRSPASEALQAENEDLRRRLAEAEETLQAIRDATVDAFVGQAATGAPVYTGAGADYPYRLMVESMNEGAVTLLPDGTLVFCNPRFAAMAQQLPSALLGADFLPLLAPADRPRFTALAAQAQTARVRQTFHLQRRGAPDLPVQIAINHLQAEGLDGLSLILSDLTEPVAAEMRIRLLNRLYATLSQINQTLLRVPDRATLFAEICRVAIQAGAYRLAWIGLSDPATHLVVPAASAGDDQGYLTGLRITDQDEPLGRGPTGSAIRLGRVFVCQAIATDPAMEPWRPRLLECGLHSSASVPIRQGGRSVGAFTVYAGEPHAFSPDDIALLTETGDNISFALDAFETAAQRRRAEAELAEAQERFAQAFNSSPVALLISRASDGQVVAVNDGFETLTGYTRAAAVGRTTRALGLLPERARAAHVAQIQSQGRLATMELEFRNQAGAVKQALLSTEVITLHGEPHYITSAADVTDLKRAEAALRDNELRLRVALTAANIAVFNMDRDLRYTWMYNPQLGYVAGEVVGHTDAELLPPADAEVITALKQRVLATGQSARAVVPVHPPGQTQHFDLIVEPLLAEDGAVVGLTGATLDITARVEAEARLEHQAYLLSQIHDAIITTDPLGLINLWNPAAEQLYGWTAAEALGRLISDLVPSEPLTAAQSAAAERDLAATGQYTVEVSQRRKDGQAIMVEGRASVLRTADGQITGYLSINTDITKRKQAEAELRASEVFLQSTLDALSAHIAILDDTGRILAVNAAWAAFGRANGLALPDAGIGSNYVTITAGAQGDRADEAPDITRAIGQIIAQTITEAHVEYPCHSPAEQRWFVAHLTGFGEPGRRRVVVAHENITERKQAEQALAASETQYRTLVETAEDVIIQSDLQGRHLFRNPAYYTSLGLNPDAPADRDGFSRVHPDDVAALRAALPALLAQGSAQAEYRLRHADGSWRTRAARSTVIYDAQQRPQSILTVTRDITELTQRQRELEAIAAVGGALRGMLARKPMAPAIVQELAALFTPEAIAFWAHEPASGDNLLEVAEGLWAPLLGKRFPAAQGLVGRAITTGRPYVTADLPHDPLYLHHGVVAPIQAAMVMPLLAQGLTLGALAIGRRAPFTPADLRLLNAVADIAANALLRANLYDQTVQHLEKLQALRAIDDAITSSFDVSVTLRVVLDQATRYLQVDAAEVLRFNAFTHELTHMVGHGFRGQNIRRSSVRLGDGIAGRAVLDRRTISVPNVAASTLRPGRSELLAAEGFVGFVAVPLISKGQVKGVLHLFHRAPLHLPREALDFVETLAGQAAIAVDNAELFDGLERSNVDLRVAYDATIEGWSRALDLRDKETEGHTLRVTDLTLTLAQALGLRADELVAVRRGALLHDIGKMGIPDHILHKPGPLSAEEWDIMRRHPLYAYELLAPIPYLRTALDIPYCHHEKWDGSGYPRGLKGLQIPLAARLFAVVDVWDALRSNRPYRASWPEDEVRRYLRAQAGLHFDPAILNQFLQLNLTETLGP